jgi:uncharacterized protein HemX
MSSRDLIDERRGRRRQAGGATASLLLLLAILVGGGGYNYWRNYQQELKEERPRPFKTYQTDDLEALRDAYEAEVGQAQARFSAQNQRRVRPSSQSLMAENVDEFERVKQSSVRLRDLKADVAEREARLREIDAELSYRSAQLSGLKLHMKRLITI